AVAPRYAMGPSASPGTAPPPALLTVTGCDAGSAPPLDVAKVTTGGDSRIETAGATVTCAVALFEPVVAVMVTGCAFGATPFTRPAALTLATAASLLVQVTVRPVSGWPLTSDATAVSCSESPTMTRAAAGVMASVATGESTTDGSVVV